jgi:hypothetical protein
VTPGVWRTTDQDARDHLALPVLDLDDVLHRDLDLVDLLLDLERRLALLDVGLHLALEAGVGVDDVPLAREGAQLGAERLVRVLVLVGLVVGVRLDGVGRGVGCLGELRLVLVAVHVGAVVGADLVGGLGLPLGDLLRDGVVDHLGGGLGLGRLVQVESVVHDGIRLRVVDVDVVQVGVVLVGGGVVDDVDGEVLGGLHRALLGGQDVALLRFVVLGRLLGGRRPIGVVDISFSHVNSLPFRPLPDLRPPVPCTGEPGRSGSGAGHSEDVGRDPHEQHVQAVDDRHHHDDEPQHHRRVLQQLLARRGDDLAELGEDLTDEQGDASEDVRLLLARRRRSLSGDDLALRLVLNHRCHLITFREPTRVGRTLHVNAGCCVRPEPCHRCCADAQGGQESNLQPAVLETAALPIELPP